MPLRLRFAALLRKSRLIFTLACASLHLAAAEIWAADLNPSAAKVQFESSMAPLFVKHCLSCHNASEAKGGLDLTSREGLLKGGDSGPAISIVKSEKSYLLERVTKGEMPPPGKGARLTAQQTTQLAAWIKAGAVWPNDRILSPFEFTTELRGGLDWWSLQPLSRPKIPVVRHQDRVRNPIDAFVLDKLEKKGLSIAEEAGRVVWLRRATFDLWGLPPTPEEIDGFAADRSADAYEKVVDHLLASPHYGERWGRHWLDVVRFGESQGFEYDRIREHAWRYRDYVIQSLNDDKPYSQFIREQIAGDVLEPVTLAGMVASGMLVAGPWDQAGSKAQKSVTMRMRVHEDELEDTLGVVAQTFLGLTLNCARCHDHKFDAISQRDYYRVKAVFDGVEFGEDRPLLTPAERKERGQSLAEINRRVKETETRLAQLEAAVRQRAIELRRFRAGPMNISPAELQAASSEEQRQEKSRLTEELRRLQAALQSIPPVPMTYGAASRQPGPTFLLKRGDVEQPGEQVTAGGLSAVKPPTPEFDLSPEASESQRRIKFADWLASADNPLTARVMVNRVWHYHFGRGIVGSPNDFGFNGDRPTHPELLDWLAREFIEQGWSLKRLHRLIMLSSTYQQSSRFNPLAVEQDAEDRLLWRFAPRRLEAEAVRDAMLLVSGELNPTMGGPSFRPFDVRNFNANVYTITDPIGPEFNRRTVYRINVNAAKSPLLEALDCPDPTVKTPRRSITTTPLQALGLMNNSFVLRQANKLAQRIERETPAAVASTPEKTLSWQLDRAYRLTLGRPPRPAELTAMTQLARDHGLPTACWTLLNATEFMYVE